MSALGLHLHAFSGPRCSACFVRNVLPEHYLNSDSRDAIRLSIGVIGAGAKNKRACCSIHRRAMQYHCRSWYCWLAIIFASFSLFESPNPIVVFAFFVCAFSAAGAPFLIFELDWPFTVRFGHFAPLGARAALT